MRARLPDRHGVSTNGLCHLADQPECPGQIVGDAMPPPPDMPPGFTCFGRGFFHVCLKPPSGSIVLDGDIDTDTDPRCMLPADVSVIPASPEVCVISADFFSVMDVRPLGIRPLVIYGARSITVTGTLDASENGGSADVAGSQQCTAELVQTGATNTDGGGGGGGGGDRGVGGAGGKGRGIGGGVFGTSRSVPDHLHGGCPGGPGGIGTSGSMAGTGGPPGGVVVVMVGLGQIEITGTVNVGGAGGEAGSKGGGGGGGGAGGLIILDADGVKVHDGARVIGNGGGGGGGSCNGVMSDAQDGDDGGGTLAVGGTATQTSDAGRGGNGSFADVLVGSIGHNSDVSCGAGGGGGGAGYTLIYTQSLMLDAGSLVSPTPLLSP